MFNINKYIFYKNSKKYQWNVNSYIKCPVILTNHYSVNGSNLGLFLKNQSGVNPSGYAPAYCDGYLPSRYKLQSILTRNLKNNNKISYPIKNSVNNFPYYSQKDRVKTWLIAKGACGGEGRGFYGKAVKITNFNSDNKIKISKLVGVNKSFLSQVLKKVKYHRRYLTTWELDLRPPYKSKKDKKWYKKRNKIIEFKLKYVERKQKRFQKRFNSILKLYQFQFLLSRLLNLNYSIRGFFWQSKKFLRYFLIHPYLLQKVIQLLNFSSFLRLRNSKIISKKKFFNNPKYFSKSSVYANSCSQYQILFLTQFWIIFFDYFYLVSQKQSKWKGIRILLSGRLGYQKMGRAKKYLRYWGTTKMSQAIFPLQYTYSQIRGRYGVVGMKIAIH